MSKLSKKEMAALAMHELMVREQRKYQLRASEQREISLMSDEGLLKLVEGFPLDEVEEERREE